MGQINARSYIFCRFRKFQYTLIYLVKMRKERKINGKSPFFNKINKNS